MSDVTITCAQCGALALKRPGCVNRARAVGAPLYCSTACSGLARRKWKSQAEKKAAKAAYDSVRRASLADQIRILKREYHKRTYDPVAAAVVRKKRMPYHVEYCRRPEYRAWKREYDRVFRAKKFYGDFADCFLLIMDIRDECLSQQTDYEIRFAKGGVAKSQQRRRAYEKSVRNHPEVGPVGDLERGQGWQDGGLPG